MYRINIFFHFFLHKSINQPQSCSKLQFFFLIQDFYSLIAKFINDVTDFEKKKNTKLLIFNIKSDCGLEFFYFYHSLGHVKD